MNSVTLSFKILPLVPEEKLYSVVDAVIALIKSRGIKHEVGASETTMEGTWDQLLPVVLEAQELCISLGASRVSTIMMMDYKPSGVTIEEKTYQYR